MRDAVDIIGLEIIYNNQLSKVDSIKFVPSSGSMYITLQYKDNTYVNIPYDEGYELIKQQINRL